MNRLLLLNLALLALPAGWLRAGTIIDTNLPAGAFIVNIDGTADGAAGNDPTDGLFSQPYNTDPEVTVAPGTYEFTIVDPADAAAEFPSLTSAQLMEIQTAWTFNTPWTTDYVVFDSSAVTNPGEDQLFDGADATYNADDTYSSAQAAYDAASTGGYRNFIRTGPRTSTTFETTYTVTQTTTLLFAVPDFDLSDNAGGVSVIVQAVPEPGTLKLALAAGALCGVTWLWRRRTGRTRAA